MRQETDIIADIDIVGGMRHQHNRMSLVGQFAQKHHHLAVQARIKARGWLIQEEEAGICQQFQRNRDALALPAGQLLDQQLAALPVSSTSSSTSVMRCQICSSVKSPGSRILAA